MRRLPQAAIAFLLLCAVGCDSKTGDANGPANPGGTKAENVPAWPTVKDDDNSFTVSMPAQPTEQNQSVPVPQGKIEIRMHELVTKQVNYTVGSSEYPPGFLARMGPEDETILRRAAEATIKQTNASNVVTEAITVGGFKGRKESMEVTVPQTGRKGTLRKISVIAKGRMYIAQSIVLDGAPAEEHKNAKRFLDSFKLNVR